MWIYPGGVRRALPHLVGIPKLQPLVRALLLAALVALLPLFLALFLFAPEFLQAHLCDV